MSVRLLFIVAALFLVWRHGALARDLAVALPARGSAEAGQRSYLAPFTAATGVAAQGAAWDGDPASLGDKRDPASLADWDVLAVSADALTVGCESGALERLDWTRVGGREHYIPQGVSDCGVGTAMVNTVLAWDKDKFGTTPTWPDFWDVAKYPGKRGLSGSPEGTLEFALLADGVAQADVYKTLRTADGVDRAFRKLDQLKPYVLWWKTGEEAAKILALGEVLMTSAPNSVLTAANRPAHRNFGVQWAGSLSRIKSWAIVKSSPNERQAYDFLYIAGSAAIEAAVFEATGNGGFAKGANEGLAPELAALSPTNPGNLATALPVDEAFWRDNKATLTERFTSWLSNSH